MSAEGRVSLQKMAQTFALIFYFAIPILLKAAQGWLQDGEPIFNLSLQTKSFRGNESGHNFFRLLDKDDKTIIIGGRNIIYNLTVDDLKDARKPLQWESSQAHRELCALKGKTPEIDCQNYLRISARTDDGKLLICGTNSYKPMCRHYHTLVSEGHVKGHVLEYEGTGICPHNPEHNSTSIYSHGHLYSATVADFSGSDSLIYRVPQRTEQSDLRHLNNPSFVSSLSHNDYVYFFFRETAVEYMNCGKAIYSRVARVCSKDKGGSRHFQDKWTTFLKARLNCSIQGEYPFYFDEIQSTTDVISGQYGNSNIQNEIIYGVFTTPVNAIGGSAVCAFAIRDILKAFDGEFKGQESINSNWLPVEEDKLPKKRPGKCVNDSRTLPDETVNFIKNHPLMEQAVPTFLSKPLIVKVSLEYRFTAIAVFPQVLATNGKFYDVIYIGTDKGKVIKTLNSASGQGDFNKSVNEEQRAPVETVVVSEQQILPYGVPIVQMYISVPLEKLIVIGNEVVSSVSLNHCSKIYSCSECVKIRDPHCAWQPRTSTCTWVGNMGKLNPDSNLQDIENGNYNICNKLPNSYEDEEIPSNTYGKLDVMAKLPPLGDSDKANEISNDISIQIQNINEYDSESKQKYTPGPYKINKDEHMEYTASALHIAIFASCSVTLLIGFVVGYLFSRRFRHPFFSETNFHEQHNHLNRLPPLETPLNANPTAYLPRRENKTINLVVNVPVKQDNLQHELGNKDRTHECKNSNESLDKDIKCGTLQKVKKTYI